MPRAPRTAVERRVDPEDGGSYTFGELLAFYRGRYTERDVRRYWHEACLASGPAWVPVLERARPGPRAAALVECMRKREADWRVGAVVYQAFVDRFAPPADLEAKRALYPAPCTLHAWSELPAGGEPEPETGYYTNELAFWGGDLRSLLARLDHVRELGADVLYLQPIVEAFSNHKYDTTDYLSLDPQYGTLEDFDALVVALRGAGMRLVLDGVFNHIGTRSACFREASADASSPKRSWFFFNEDGKPRVWGCAKNLAELRLESKSLREHLWEGPDSVVATWLRRGADGWRLDVASELGFEHLASLTAAAHRHKPGSLVLGEVWAYPARWTRCMDGVLSLHLGVLILGLAEGELPGPSAAQALERLCQDSSQEELLRSWIVLSNHDLPRLASRLPDAARRRLAQQLQFALPGCPLVYYGDELGLEGGGDPLNRAPMPWARAEASEHLAEARALCALRRRLRALRIGDYRALPSQQLMAFCRTTDRIADLVVVLANPTDAPVREMVVLPVPELLGHTLFRDELSGEEARAIGATLTLPVAPRQLRVLALVDESGSPSGDQYKRMYGHGATLPHVRP